MKTIGEYEQEKADRQEFIHRTMSERDRKFLDELEAKDIPLYEQTDPKSNYRDDLIKDMRAALRDRIRRGEGYRQSVLCDNCGTELIERLGGMTLSEPPKTYVGCPGCGWIGFKTL